MAFLTIFTTPKPFTNPHIAVIQRNALANWQALGQDVAVIVLGSEVGAAEAAAEFGALHLPEVARNAEGTPLISDLFDQARSHADSPLLAYVNADILLLPDFVETARYAMQQRKDFLLVGQRWDLDVTEPLAFAAGWDAALRQRAQQQGKLHPPAGSDYFIFPTDAYREMPQFAIGRAGWDNWMIYHARRKGWATVDATRDIFIIHQNHDYSHLPNGQPHYKLPESFENVRLAGGRMITRFLLTDCNQQIENGLTQPQPRSSQRFWREVEIFPLVRLHSRVLGWISYAIFQPKNAFREAREWFRRLQPHPEQQK
ncbi:MAG TPA: hypothetical protein DCP32_06330 [Anaerolineaceae bacterium]|nr:MAG: hypothetical protein A2X24_07100 [Chloroflexi bacterium GWB2_54_36]HAL16366.1 hypothetical protein [Anaerolineaceae bacterium]HBA91853.1 hypothetical protein [Anaerolineaceae bacterium]